MANGWGAERGVDRGRATETPYRARSRWRRVRQWPRRNPSLVRRAWRMGTTGGSLCCIYRTRRFALTARAAQKATLLPTGRAGWGDGARVTVLTSTSATSWAIRKGRCRRARRRAILRPPGTPRCPARQMRAACAVGAVDARSSVRWTWTGRCHPPRTRRPHVVTARALTWTGRCRGVVTRPRPVPSKMTRAIDTASGANV